jgi:hypothetical protein
LLNGQEVVKVDTTQHEFAVEMGVTGLPHFMLFSGGARVDEYLGSSFDEVSTWVRDRAPAYQLAQLAAKLSVHFGANAVSATSSITSTRKATTTHTAKSETQYSAPATLGRQIDGPWLLNVPYFLGSIPASFTGPARSAAVVAADLQVELFLHSRDSHSLAPPFTQRSILSLYADFISPDGDSVDYNGMRESAQFASYVAQTAQLQACGA